MQVMVSLSRINCMVTPQYFSSSRFTTHIIHLRGLDICSMFCDETTVHFSVVSSLIESWWNLHHIRRALIRSGWDEEESRYMFGATPLQLRSMDHMPWSSALYMYSCEWFVHRSLWVLTSDSVDVQVHGHTDRNIIHQNQRAIGRCPFVGTHLERILHHLDRFYSWM